MTRQTRRRLMDRKIVELLIGGMGVNAVTRALHVGTGDILAVKVIQMDLQEAARKQVPH